jgi:acyl-CoA synthetase (AMP-forming)/AMP-acid ligase II
LWTFEYEPTIPNVLRHAVEAFPTNEYVVTPDHCLTFADAGGQSRSLAKRLLGLGASKGTRVGLWFPQGPGFVAAFLAVTRIGAIAVPLSTFYRGPELRAAIRHADIDTLIAPRELAGRDVGGLLEAVWPELAGMSKTRLSMSDAPFLRRAVICGGSDRDWATAVADLASLDDDHGIGDELLAAVERAVTPSDQMVIIFTSGATAEPKAVIHTQGAQVRQAWKLAQLYDLTGEERTFTTMPFFWTGGLTVSLLTHLHVGSTIVTVERTDSAEMLDLIESTRPTRLSGWTLLERLRADPSFGERDLNWLANVQTAPLPDPTIRHNSLGMTETCGPHTIARSSDNQVDLPEHLRGSFGPPIPGMEHKVIEAETGRVLGEGQEGEICVRGECLMEGLYGKERYETFDEDGWYHTGDKGYFLDGFLFFTGRLTEMIKTGGANVSPREVELVLESLDGVQAAFVVGLPDATRGEVVACVVCPQPGHSLDASSITDQLSSKLSSYKIPRKVMVLPYDLAPWLPSGKVSKPRIVDLFTE